MADDDIRMTYEVLFELLRRERNRDELQELSQSLYQDIERYVKEKRVMMDRFRQGGNDLEAEKLGVQILNTEKLFAELNERREKKVLMTSLYQSKAIHTRIQTKNMLAPENELFTKVLELLNSTRDRIKSIRGSSQDPVQNVESAPEPVQAQTSQEPDPSAPAQDTPSDSSSPESDSATVAVSVEAIQDIPAFMGPELEQYGPYGQGDNMSLPKEIADLLLDKGQAKLTSGLS